MKLDRQTEAGLGFYIRFFQIYQSLGSEVTPWSRGWSGCYADSHTNLLGNQKYNHANFVEVRFTSDIDESWSMMTKHEYGFLLSSLFFSSLFFSPSFSLIADRDQKEYKPSQTFGTVLYIYVHYAFQFRHGRCWLTFYFSVLCKVGTDELKKTIKLMSQRDAYSDQGHTMTI